MKLTRDIFSPTFTMGKLTFGNLTFYTCEDAVRGGGDPKTVSTWKKPGITCIPYGTYKVIISFSNRFQKHLPLLLDVPGFDGVRIHSMNYASESSGCIGIGLTRIKNGIGNSRAAMNMFMPMLEDALLHEEVYIEVA